MSKLHDTVTVVKHVNVASHPGSFTDTLTGPSHKDDEIVIEV